MERAVENEVKVETKEDKERLNSQPASALIELLKRK